MKLPRMNDWSREKLELEKVAWFPRWQRLSRQPDQHQICKLSNIVKERATAGSGMMEGERKIILTCKSLFHILSYSFSV